ncbi:1-Cys peroxiredoxin A [Vitis vinifera]|uniref:thioredoxin-dependent peroxiredoxin n=1 Tax=Vitis vinifera TaxID=29760 RepID=A0A438F7Q8_VITVI|nr:1-Cys peroxiredoxin A [Vitis vinifera]
MKLKPGSKVSYLIVSDSKSDIILLLNMVDPDAIYSYGNNLPSRVLYIIGPDKKGPHPLRTRGTHLAVTRGMYLTVTHGTHCHPGHPHPDLPIKHTWRTFYIRTASRKSKRRLQSIGIRTASINASAPQFIRIPTWVIWIWLPGSLTKVKRVSHAIATTNHGPRPITCRVKRQVEIKLGFLYPGSTGRNMDEVMRVLDALQKAAKHRIATLVNWKPGELVVIQPGVSDDEAK